MREVLTELTDVVFEYRSHLAEGMSVRAIDHVSMHVRPGSFTVVLGRNGSGKSTLSRLMNALLLPAEGTVLVDGMDSTDHGLVWQIRRTIGVVFQNPDNQIVATTVEEDVAFGPENLGIAPEEIRSRVDDSLARVAMTDYLGHSPHMLSGGQKQRVAIAGVLAMKPKCIVLDEATSMLDPQGREEVLAVIRQLNREFGIAVVLITHHMSEAVAADHIFVMKKGRLILEGTPHAVFSEVELLRDAGLDVPQVTAIAHLVRDLLPEMQALPISPAEMKRLSMPILSNGASDLTAATSAAESELVRPRRPEDVRTDAETVIRISDLTHVYMPDTPYQRKALDSVSLTVRRGEILGIVGHTGSGKSTLIQHLNGLLKPTSGSVTVAGLAAEGKSLKELRRKVGLIFQYPEHQLFDETVYRDIAFGLAHMGLTEAEIDVRVKGVAATVGLDESLLDKSPFELSGGQKRRAAIAGVLAMDPEILILDEPTAGLDPVGSREIFRILRELNLRQGTTMLLVSHSMEDIAQHADRVAVMHAGRLDMLDAPSAVFGRMNRMKELRLGVPQVTELFLDLLPSHPPVLTVADGAALLAAAAASHGEPVGEVKE